MVASLDNPLIEEDLFFDITELNVTNKEVAIFKRLVEKALFSSTTEERQKYQNRISRRYHETIKSLDILNGERITFTIENPDGEYACNLCQLPESLMDKPYYPVLFSI
jgi:hypothetical protein